MRKLALASVLVAIFIGTVAGQQDSGVAPRQKSDTFVTDESGHKLRVQHGELAAGNFQIAGVDLALEEDVFKQATRILGRVEIRSTGDAGDADGRICYRPIDKSDTTRLYFHAGEVAVWFVLSSRTPTAERVDVCRASNRIAKSLSTASGLHLGQSEKQVITILGLPTRRDHNVKTGFDSMVYDYETEKKASASELAAARKENPQMSEAELLKTYGSYDLSETIEMKFVGGLMTKLEVTWIASD